MAKVKNTVAVDHKIVSGNLEQLSNYVAGRLGEGFRIADLKIMVADFHNQEFSVLYIFVKDAPEE